MTTIIAVSTPSPYRKHDALRGPITTSVFFAQEHETARSQEKNREIKFITAIDNLLMNNTAGLVKYIWDRLKGNVPGVIGLRVPVLDVLNEGAMLTWDQGNYHLDAEIFPGQSVEFFFRNRQTGEVWNREFDIVAKLPEDFLVYLRYFQL